MSRKRFGIDEKNVLILVIIVCMFPCKRFVSAGDVVIAHDQNSFISARNVCSSLHERFNIQFVEIFVYS